MFRGEKGERDDAYDGTATGKPGLEDDAMDGLADVSWSFSSLAFWTKVVLPMAADGMWCEAFRYRGCQGMNSGWGIGV